MTIVFLKVFPISQVVEGHSKRLCMASSYAL